mgnify:CR=1 FL=1
MNVTIFSSEHELNEAAAQLIAGLVIAKPDAVLGLATGSTPIGIYRELRRAYERNIVSFRRVRTFNLDEYVGLGENHPQSYRHYMNEHLFRHVDVPPENIHIPDGTATDLAEECRRYDRLLDQAGPIDLQLLGIGHNGHIGFNEPNGELASRTHVTELNAQTRNANARFFQTMDEVPTHAITMGVGDILKAKTVVLVAKGADKADILCRALTGPITTDCPASLLQTHPHLIVLADAEAGRLLR